MLTRDLATGAERRSGQPFIPALVRFRPDGLRYAVAEVTALGRTEVCADSTDLSGRRSCLATGVTSGMDYLPDGRILMAGSGGSAEAGRSVISLLRPEGGMGTGVERVLVRDPAANIESPSVAPDSRSVVAVGAPLSGGVRDDLARYDLATGDLGSAHDGRARPARGGPGPQRRLGRRGHPARRPAAGPVGARRPPRGAPAR